jgi:hypothetical protein
MPKTVLLDTERKVVLNLYAMKKFRELTGKSVMQLKEEDVTEEEISALTFAALLTFNPDITIEQVDKMVDMGNMTEVYAAIMGTSMAPEDRKQKNK